MLKAAKCNTLVQTTEQLGGSGKLSPTQFSHPPASALVTAIGELARRI